METAFHYCTKFQIGGILHDRAIDKRRYVKSTPQHELYNWFTNSLTLEFGAAYGAHFLPVAPLRERIKIFSKMLDDPAFAVRARLGLFDEVIASEPYRIGVQVESIAWDFIDHNEFLTWYGVLRPVRIDEWVSFEQLKGGKRDRGTLNVTGQWVSMGIPELMKLVNLYGSFLEAADPPWKDYYKRFE